MSWIGIAGSVDRRKQPGEHLWWCLPEDACIDDFIFAYLPRHVSAVKQGVYALYRVTSFPELQNDPRRYYCAPYGNGHLRFAELKLLAEFKFPVVAKELKDDLVLSRSNIVRRNFQATTSKLNDAEVARLLTLLERKNGEIAST